MAVNIKWSEVNYGESEQRVYRSDTSMDPNNLPTPLTTLGPNINSYTDESVSIGNTYYYIISSIVGGVEYTSTEKSITVEYAYPVNGLILHYTMDNRTGTTIHDERGNFEGTNSGANIVPGLTGEALDFSPNAAKLTTATKVLPDPNQNDWTISLWISMDGVSFDEMVFFSQDRLGTPGEIGVGIDSGKVMQYQYNNTFFTTSPLNRSDFTEPLHLVYIRSGNSILFYEDGVLLDTKNVNTTYKDNGVTQSVIGNRIVDGNANKFNSWIDELMIYDRAITASEVLDIYNALKP